MRTKALPVRICMTVAATFLLTSLIASHLSAASSPWPARKAELCWIATAPGPEYSFVRALVTNMGADHYLFHGQAFRVNNTEDLEQIGDLQALGGNVEYDPDLDAWIGQITKTEYNSGWLEVYTGLMALEATSLDGQVEGVISTCEAGSQNTNCLMLNTGPIDMTYISCP